MLGPVSRVKTNISLRHLFHSSAPDLQTLKQKTVSGTSLTRTPIRRNEKNNELTSDDEMLARRHGE